MEKQVLISVSLLLFTVAVFLVLISTLHLIRRIKAQRRVEVKVHEEIHRLAEQDVQLKALLNQLTKDLQRRGQASSETFKRLSVAVTEILEGLEEKERRFLMDGVYQPSEQGRARYMTKLAMG